MHTLRDDALALTLAGQSLGSMVLGLEALLKKCPHIFFGNFFIHPLQFRHCLFVFILSFLGGCVS